MVATELFGLTRQEQNAILNIQPLKAVPKFMCCGCKQSKPITERANYEKFIGKRCLKGGVMCFVCRERAEWVAKHKGATLQDPYGRKMVYRSGNRTMTAPLHPADW